MNGVKQLFKGNFLKSLTILASGSFLAYVVLGVEQILAARIFTPEALGIFSFIMAVPQAFLGVLCGRYELPIVYEEDENRVYPLIKLNMIITLSVSFLVSLGCTGYFVFFKSDYIRFLYLLPAVFIYLLSYGMTLTLNSYNNRYREYKMIARMHILRTVSQCVGTLLFGLIFVTCLKIDAAAVPCLVFPYCMGMAVGIFTQGKTIIEHRREILSISAEEVAAAAKFHIRQPLLSAPAIFANSYSYSLITIFLEGLFGSRAAGYYSLSSKLLGMPISLVSGNMSKVYMEEASREYNRTGGYRKAFVKTFLFLFALAIPMFFCMYFLAPPVCGFLLGAQWVVAGRYIKALALMFAVRFIATALSPGLYVCNKQQSELFIQLALLAVTVAAGIISYFSNLEIIQFLSLISYVRSGVMIALILLVFYYSKVRTRKNKKQFSKIPELYEPKSVSKDSDI